MRFLPGVEERQALGRLAVAKRLVGVHGEAISAAVDLRGAELEEVEEPGVDVLGDQPLELEEVTVSVGRDFAEVHAEGFGGHDVRSCVGWATLR